MRKWSYGETIERVIVGDSVESFVAMTNQGLDHLDESGSWHNYVEWDLYCWEKRSTVHCCEWGSEWLSVCICWNRLKSPRDGLAIRERWEKSLLHYITFSFICFKSFQSLIGRTATLSGSFQFSSTPAARSRRSAWTRKFLEPGSRETDLAMRVRQPRSEAQGRWICQPSQIRSACWNREEQRTYWWPSTGRTRKCYTNNGALSCLKI